MVRFKKAPIGIGIHHSLTKDGLLNDTAAIRRYHMSPALNGNIISMAEYNRLKILGTRGLKSPWDEIGYHALVERIDDLIQITPGRPLEFQGAHCPELNATHLGLCIVGNFDLTSPDNGLLDAAAHWCREQIDFFHMQLKNIVYHCDHSSKSCPGKNFPKAGFLLQLAGEERPEAY